MSANSYLDRESFQQVLANAYAIQESRIDPQFLSAMLNVERLVTKGDLEAEGAMNLVVDSARDVAGAAGAAVGLLQGDLLIYRAGSGCAAAHVGGRMAASLTVSAKTKMTHEILRVENAHTDTRVEGAICRQFGAESLLILPIYLSAACTSAVRRDQPLAGVLMILFGAAHAFQDGEIRMYRLMAGLIETAMGQATEAQLQAPTAVPALSKVVAIKFERKPPCGERTFQDTGPVFYNGSSDGVYVRCQTALASVRKSTALRQSNALAEFAVQRATESISSNPLRGLAVAAVVVGLGLTLWISHGSRAQGLPTGSPTVQNSGLVNNLQHRDVLPAVGEAAATTEPKRTLAAAHVRHAPAGSDELEHIGDDVTVRHFTHQASRQHQQAASRVAYMGTDVTVRYFTPASTVGARSR
jgi:hypothetical protein